MGGQLVEAILSQAVDVFPPVVMFCCADCQRDRRRAREESDSGQVMGVAFKVDDGWFWGNTHNHDFKERGINWRFPLDNRTEPVAMSCRVRSHPPRPRLPQWITSRAEKALAGDYGTVHL